MTEPSGWLDMSRYPDHDPDTVLTADQHGLLTSALAVDDADVPDAVWEHMLAAVIGTTDPVDDPSEADGAPDDGAPDDDDPGWADLEHGVGLDAAAGTEPADGSDHHGTDPTEHHDDHHGAGEDGAS